MTIVRHGTRLIFCLRSSFRMPYVSCRLKCSLIDLSVNIPQHRRLQSASIMQQHISSSKTAILKARKGSHVHLQTFIPFSKRGPFSGCAIASPRPAMTHFRRPCAHPTRPQLPVSLKRATSLKNSWILFRRARRLVNNFSIILLIADDRVSRNKYLIAFENMSTARDQYQRARMHVFTPASM